MRVFCFEVKFIGFKFFPRNAVLKAWLETDNKIMAIKKHREITGSSLNDARKYVISLVPRYNILKLKKDNK